MTQKTLKKAEIRPKANNSHLWSYIGPRSASWVVLTICKVAFDLISVLELQLKNINLNMHRYSIVSYNYAFSHKVG